MHQGGHYVILSNFGKDRSQLRSISTNPTKNWKKNPKTKNTFRKKNIQNLTIYKPNSPTK